MNARRRSTSWVAWVLRPVAAFGARAVAACPRCYESSSPQVLTSYYLSTFILTVLPLVVVGAIAAIGWHLARRFRAEPDAASTVEPATR